MGEFTAWDHPLVDQIVSDHMQQIVLAIRSRIEPRAIVLRGSFSQGEGSVVVEGDRLRFLSDYEIMAITPHYRHRRWLRQVSRDMTEQLGVETSISRVHPRNIQLNSLSNLTIKQVAQPTIAMYEVQRGGRTLYGEHLLNRGPTIDPRSLDLWPGLRLIFNRMAESLGHISLAGKNWEGLRWINKTVLSCAEALLIAHRAYHHSYAERGRRFAALVPDLSAVFKQAEHLPDLVQRATEFKLHPALNLYPEPILVIWEQVKRACDASLRYVIESYLGFSFGSYAEFPGCYLAQLQKCGKMGRSRLRPLPAPLSQNLFLAAKLLRSWRRPSLRLVTQATYPAHQVAFAVVPLMFVAAGEEDLYEARRWLAQVMDLQPIEKDAHAEREYLRACAVRAWKDYCYGLWDSL
jgi:hypothetical protein